MAWRRSLTRRMPLHAPQLAHTRRNMFAEQVRRLAQLEELGEEGSSSDGEQAEPGPEEGGGGGGGSAAAGGGGGATRREATLQLQRLREERDCAVNMVGGEQGPLLPLLLLLPPPPAVLRGALARGRAPGVGWLVHGLRRCAAAPAIGRCLHPPLHAQPPLYCPRWHTTARLPPLLQACLLHDEMARYADQASSGQRGDWDALERQALELVPHEDQRAGGPAEQTRQIIRHLAAQVGGDAGIACVATVPCSGAATGGLLVPLCVG
jgi:hypothetical protein